MAGNSRGAAADAEFTGRLCASKPTKNQLKQVMIRMGCSRDQQFLCPLHCVNKCWPYERTCNLAHDDVARLVKRPTLRSCVRQSIDGERAEKTPEFDVSGSRGHRERCTGAADPSCGFHVSRQRNNDAGPPDSQMRQEGRARVRGPKFEVFGTSNPERRTSDRACRARRARRALQKSSVRRSTGDCLLLDGTALSLRGEPFSFHLLNECGAVHMEQLSRLTRNPIGLAKRANDQTVLKLFDLS